tara:strand:+ start:397 stop:657 length:261 start_codon:yes stop_codon:yes gene_type:complete
MKIVIDGADWEVMSRSCYKDEDGCFNIRARPIIGHKGTIAERATALARVDLIRGRSEVVLAHVAQAAEQRVKELEERLIRLEKMHP